MRRDATADIQGWRVERKAALETLDMEWARKAFPLASSDEVLICGMHKARYECTDISSELRQESGRWLKERGYKRIAGLPWSADGSLPA